MQVVSGLVGRRRAYSTAPPAARLGDEVSSLLQRFGGRGSTESVLALGTAHLWLISILLFEEGNGHNSWTNADMGIVLGGGGLTQSVRLEAARRAKHHPLQRYAES